MRIAVCDDERVEREKTVAALGTVLSEFTVSEFESGDELVKSHGERAFELIILDIMLMYGREAQSKTRIASPATIPKSGERNRKIHSCMLYLISI